MRARPAVLPACFLALAAASCDSRSGEGPGSVGLAPAIVFPRGLLDNVATLVLDVYDTVDAKGASTGVDCSATTAAQSGIPTGLDAMPPPQPFITENLGTSQCQGGAKFCGSVQMVESGSDRVFFASGKSGAGDTVANGCVRVTVNKDALPVLIKMIHYVPPNVCGNGVVEPGETCDAPASQDPACSGQTGQGACQTIEELLSGGSAATFTSNGKAGDKTNPNFVWPDKGEFNSFFSDKSPATFQVTMRVLSDTLVPTSSHGSAVQSASFFLPNDPTGQSFPPPPTANDNKDPASAVLALKYYVAFDGDSAGTFDIHLRSMDASLTAEQAPPQCIINGGGSGEPGAQTLPAVSAGNAALFVAWQDAVSGGIAGRTYTPGTPCGTLGAQQTLSSGTGNAGASLAHTGDGWVAVWQSGPNVKMRPIGEGGTPSGAEQPVNDSSHVGTQDHARVASFGDGRFAIVWADHGSAGATAIVVQRYDAMGRSIAGDQDTKVNNLTTGDEISPFIAASTAASGYYVIAWVDSGAPNHVRARLLAGSGGATADGSAYLFNTVTGQSDEFQVSIADNRVRANPTAAVGGAGHIAFGWEDNAPDANSGIKTRRFPSPTQ